MDGNAAKQVEGAKEATFLFKLIDELNELNKKAQETLEMNNNSLVTFRGEQPESKPDAGDRPDRPGVEGQITDLVKGLDERLNVLYDQASEFERII